MEKRIRLVLFDMEGTLTTEPTLWEIMHLKNGTWESHGLPYWETYKAGGMGYDEFARKDVAAWRDAPTRLYDRAAAEVPLMTGCEELMAWLSGRGIMSGIVSNGLLKLARRLQAQFDMRTCAANEAVVVDGHLTGELRILVPYAEKLRALRRIAADLGLATDEVLVVGDGPADAMMFGEAGRSIAFLPENASVAQAADCVIDRPDLRCAVPFIEEWIAPS